MLVVPFAHDQPDNAARLTRLGVARTLYPYRYRPASAERELRRLLEDPSYSRRAAEVAEVVRREDGVRAACEALEPLLHRGSIPPNPVAFGAGVGEDAGADFRKTGESS